MGYDRGDSFPFDFEPNGFPFGDLGDPFPDLAKIADQCSCGVRLWDTLMSGCKCFRLT